MVATIYDVASLAGVSTATVSRVMNKTGNVTPKTEEKVKKAMKQLNFSPNSLAQNFAKMRSGTIGFIMTASDNVRLKNNYMDSIYFTEIFRGINNVLLSEEYSMLIINSKNKFTNIIQEFLDQKKIEGLIIGSNPANVEGFKEAIIQKKSIVYVGNIEGFNQGLHVYAQFIQYINKVIAYFVENGHRNIAYFGISEENEKIVQDLIKNIRDVQINYCSISDSIEETQNAIKKVFSAQNRPSALFYESFDKIQPVLSTLSEMNLSVPKDVSLISVEHTKGLGASYIPNITNVYVPAYEMGKVAARVLLDYLNGNIDNYDQLFTLESNIIERGSVKTLDE